LADDLPNASIGEALLISQSAVENHISPAFAKLASAD
jgi:DNA-binding CsgD family transcriptional regulator